MIDIKYKDVPLKKKTTTILFRYRNEEMHKRKTCFSIRGGFKKLCLFIVKIQHYWKDQ